MTASATTAGVAVPAWFAHCADLLDGLTFEQRARVLRVAHSSYLEGDDLSREGVREMARVERGELTTADALAQLRTSFSGK